MTRNIAFFVYQGFVLLDLSGPLEAFAAAEDATPGSYSFNVMSLAGGEVGSSTGLSVMTKKVSLQSIDTLIVVGDFALAHSEVEDGTIRFIQKASLRARRTASVCMGAFLLAASGLLDGRRATTHWRYAARLQSRYPAIRVDGDRIFINEAGMWTSAGMTAGIDMALSMIEEDLGIAASRSVAMMLVVYHRRAGGQYQHSALLDLDPHSDRIRGVLTYARTHLSDPLSLEALSNAACLSVRQFSRAFLLATGTTPAKALERMRVEAARPRIEDTSEMLTAIAQTTGFADPERMCQSFIRVLGQTPQQLRRAARMQTGNDAQGGTST